MDFMAFPWIYKCGHSKSLGVPPPVGREVLTWDCPDCLDEQKRRGARPAGTAEETRAASQKTRHDLNLSIRHYLEMHTRGLPELAKREDVTRWAYDSLLGEDDILGIATASIADPTASYSPEAVKSLLRLLMKITPARGMNADYFLIMQAVEDTFKALEARGDMEAAQRLRERLQVLADVLVPPQE
jgi:hypothetical protein